MSDVLRSLAGKFVVFDGPDGCGKTTQMKLLIARLESEGVKVCRLREPGGSPIGEQIRDLLLSTKNEGMDVRCEMLLYMASRAQLVYEKIHPAIRNNECVLSDRFASSTLAYQGGGGGMNLSDIQHVARIATQDTFPHLTIIFDLDTEIAMQRINPLWGGTAGSRKKDDKQSALFADADLKDRIEQRARDYFERVRENYLWQVQQWPERYRIIDAGKSVAQVEKSVMKTLLEFFSPELAPVES